MYPLHGMHLKGIWMIIYIFMNIHLRLFITNRVNVKYQVHLNKSLGVPDSPVTGVFYTVVTLDDNSNNSK